jgi:hypothetical protein
MMLSPISSIGPGLGMTLPNLRTLRLKVNKLFCSTDLRSAHFSRMAMVLLCAHSPERHLTYPSNILLLPSDFQTTTPRSHKDPINQITGLWWYSSFLRFSCVFVTRDILGWTEIPFVPFKNQLSMRTNENVAWKSGDVIGTIVGGCVGMGVFFVYGMTIPLYL